jgi:hypothetical protein
MGANELSADLLRARRRFEAWRRQHQRGCRLPQALWNRAVRLAARHGISRTSSALRLDYYTLKRRLAEVPASQPSSAFVELPAPLMVGKQCLVEFDSAAGARLRMDLRGYDTADLEALARSLWSAD